MNVDQATRQMLEALESEDREAFETALSSLGPLDAEPLDAAAALKLEDVVRTALGSSLVDAGARAGALALDAWHAAGQKPGVERCRRLVEDLAGLGAAIPVGPFDLIRPLGAGGMGEVWQALHHVQRAPVAVKVLHGKEARSASGLRAFASEIRAVAALRHPHVVYVLDHGLLGHAAEAMSAGRLVAGSPYLAMELGRGGSLVPWQGRLTWPACRPILLQLLDALAHAHARGLIHRDLKPGNVLMHHPGNLGHGIRLTDFGLARALDATDKARVAGTPAYMAPEQLTGRWQYFGPWTDLYAFGCLAWTLVTGSPPFTGELEVVRSAHIRLPPPPLWTRLEVPSGLEEWLRVLLAKDPRARFQCAADAAHALQALGDVRVDESTADPEPAENPATPTASETFVFDVWSEEIDPDEEPTIELGALPTSTRPPIPESWRRNEPAPLPPQLLGVGLGMFRLREIPVAGRLAERDHLWSALRSSETRALVLQGPAGVGKSRLAAWTRVRAAELGAAEPIDVVCHPDLDAGSLRPKLVGRGRRMVLVLDDAHRSVGAVEFVRTLLRDPPDAGALVLLTVRDDELGQDLSRALDRLLETPGAERIEMGPLDATSMSRLVEDLLRLETSIAARIVERAQGSPQFAIELVGDLIARGVFVPGPKGFVLSPGARLELPDGLHELWRARIDGVLETLPAGAGEALEIAAVLGQEVDRAEHIRAAAEGGVLVPTELQARLEEQGLARNVAGGWGFAQSMLRESLVRRASEGGRLSRWHAACARVVPEEQLLRRGRHLSGSGELEDAIPLLLDGTLDAGTPSALEVLEHVEELLGRLGVPDEDTRRAQLTLNRAEALLERSRYAEVLVVGQDLASNLERPGWAHHATRAISCRGRALRAVGRYDDAAVELTRAVELFREQGNPSAATHPLHGLGLVDKIQGRLEVAEARIAEALVIMLEVGASERAIGTAWMSRGSVALVAGDLQLAEECVQRALAIGRRTQLDILTASALAGLAEVDRQLDRLDLAEARYEESWRMLREAGLGRALVVRLNLGIVYSLREDWVRARDTLLEIQAAVRRQGRRGLDGVCAALVVPCSVALDRPDEARGQLLRAQQLLDGLGIAEPDVARALETAADLAGGEFALDCLEVAESQWARAGLDADRRRVAARIAQGPT